MRIIFSPALFIILCLSFILSANAKTIPDTANSEGLKQETESTKKNAELFKLQNDNENSPLSKQGFLNRMSVVNPGSKKSEALKVELKSLVENRNLVDLVLAYKLACQLRKELRFHDEMNCLQLINGIAQSSQATKEKGYLHESKRRLQELKKMEAKDSFDGNTILFNLRFKNRKYESAFYDYAMTRYYLKKYPSISSTKISKLDRIKLKEIENHVSPAQKKVIENWLNGINDTSYSDFDHICNYCVFPH